MKKSLYTLALCAVAAAAQAQIEQPITTEYFFDKDPGFGKGINAGTTSTEKQEFNAKIDNLKPGFHTLYVRGQNVYGWSHTTTFQFVLFEKTNQIVGTEYFFDEDPGKGNGKFTPVKGNDTIQSVKTNAAKLDIDVENIDPGYHSLSVRAMNSDKTWSEAITSPFVYLKTPEVPKRAEYYFDHDPGFGNGTPIKEDGTKLAFSMDASSLRNGNHILYIRAQDAEGTWNIEETSPFSLKKDSDNVKANWSIPIYISPNPAQYSFSIQFGKEIASTDSVLVTITSKSGKELTSKNYAVVNNVITISTAPYSSGSYLITVQKDWLSASKRLVIKKRQDDTEEQQ